MPGSAADYLDAPEEARAAPAAPQPAAADFLDAPDSFTARTTGYHPVAPGSPEYRMEGGFQDRKGAPIYTLDQYLRGDAPYVTVAGDHRALPYGTELTSPQFPGVPFRWNDTGGAFKGKGTSRVDIARDNAAGANSDVNNRPVTFTPSPTPAAPPSASAFLDDQPAAAPGGWDTRPTPVASTGTAGTPQAAAFQWLWHEFGDQPLLDVPRESVQLAARLFAPNVSKELDAANQSFPVIDKVRSGLVTSGQQTLNGLTTPKNIAILGALAAAPEVGVPSIAARAISLGFSAQSAAAMGEELKAAASSTGDPEQLTQHVANAVTQGAFATLAGLHAAGGEPATAERPPAQSAADIAPPKAADFLDAEEPATPAAAPLPKADEFLDAPDQPAAAGIPPEAPPLPEESAPAAPPVGTTLEPGTIPIKDLPAEPATGGTAAVPSESAAEPAPVSAVAQILQDPAVPFMTKARLQQQIGSAGLSDEQIHALSPEEVQQILTQRPPAAAPATDPFAPVRPETGLPVSGQAQPTSVRATPEEIAAEQEHQRETLAAANEHFASSGPELLDAIKAAGGLPAKASPYRRFFAGELADLTEAARDPRSGRTQDLFRTTAPDVDNLVTSLRDRGFNFQTPADLFDALGDRLRTGNPQHGLPSEVQTFASGTAAPRAAAPSSAATAPKRAPGPPLPSPLPAPRGGVPSRAPTLAAVAPLRSWWIQRTLGLRKLVAPQTIDLPARRVANIVRDYNGRLANKIIQADHALDAARRDFDRTPVPSNWKYDPAKPLPRNYAFMAETERGGNSLAPADRALKQQLDTMFSEAVDEVHRVRPTALQSLIQDYFPHIWKDPEAARRAFAGLVGHRPLEGSKSFLKQRTLAYIEDGLKAGLQPLSDNPIDMVLTKLHEMHKFVAAQDMLAEAKAIGARKFVYIFEKPPEGWVKVDDASSTVHGPPFVKVSEAFDAQMKAKTIELLDQLGIKHSRVMSLGGKRLGDYTTGGAGIRTKFGTPISVYWHELGHGLQERYGWLDTILGTAYDKSGQPLGPAKHTGNSPVALELRKLADLRAEGQPPSKSFKSYIRSADEKSAVILEAYMHAPRRMEQVAPLTYGRVRKFIAAHPELHPIEDIRPSLVLGTAKGQVPVGGLVTLGNHYMPEGAATVFNNYLSPGLQSHKIFGPLVRNIRNSTNILSGAQLGFSAFHAGFTSIDAAVSQFALGLQYASEGKLARAATKILSTPAAPVTNYLTGRAVQRAMLDPGYGSPELQTIAQLAIKAGLRADVDPFWKTQVTRNMLRAFHEGGVKGYAGTILRAPLAVSEQLMRPILEKLVPRQKYGVFAGMAQQAMERLGPGADIHTVRDAMAHAADATEDRMGQMTYDNLFYNRVVRDSALLGFRAYGWTLGKYRALFGGISDTFGTIGRVQEGGPVLTPRMAYLVALPIVASTIGSVMHYTMTGRPPQDWRDMLMPQTGKLDRNGNPQRLSLPTYMKDMLSDWHDFPNARKMLVSLTHKLNPWISIASDVLGNADFYNTKVFNEDDPWLKQQGDKVLFVAKSATPFTVTGMAKLSESKPSPGDYALPFFGFVPAKAALSMTAAQTRAAELFQDSLPRGARTQEQANRSQLIAQLTREFQAHDPNYQADVSAALARNQIQPTDMVKFPRAPLTPLEFQVKGLAAEDAMKVWDLANDQERNALRPLLYPKIGNSKTLTPDQRTQFLQVLSQPSR